MDEYKTEKILKTKDVSALLGVSVNTVRLWREKGRGPKYFERGYGRYFYKQSDVAEFAREKGYDTGAE